MQELELVKNFYKVAGEGTDHFRQNCQCLAAMVLPDFSPPRAYEWFFTSEERSMVLQKPLTLPHHWRHSTSKPNPQSGTEEKLTKLVIMKQLANALGAN